MFTNFFSESDQGELGHLAALPKALSVNATLFKSTLQIIIIYSSRTD
jgi:hypothetical protein